MPPRSNKLPNPGKAPRIDAAIPKLHVRRPNAAHANPCLTVMSSLLGCWASTGYSIAGCQQFERQLRECMDTPRPRQQKGNNINFHLARFFPAIQGPMRKKK